MHHAVGATYPSTWYTHILLCSSFMGVGLRATRPEFSQVTVRTIKLVCSYFKILRIGPKVEHTAT